MIPLPRRQSIVAIFVDPETESRPTTQNTDDDGYSNLLLTRLHLDRLGTVNRVLRCLGFISGIYVMNASPQRSESSSLKIDGPRLGSRMEV